MTTMTRRARPFLIAAAAVASVAGVTMPAVAQSFDCSGSSTKAERAVCGSDRLAGLDERMSELYDRVLASTPGARGREQVRQYQRQFLAARNACGRNNGCIADAYNDQISVLTARVRMASRREY
jgi:uncharacterized protein